MLWNMPLARPKKKRMCSSGPTRGRLRAAHSALALKAARGLLAITNRIASVSDSGRKK